MFQAGVKRGVHIDSIDAVLSNMPQATGSLKYNINYGQPILFIPAAAGTDYTKVDADKDVSTPPFTFSVQILEDIIDERDEAFNLVLNSDASEIDSTFSIVTVTIIDNDSKYCAHRG